MLDAEGFELVAGGVHEGPAIPVADVLADPEAFAGESSLRLEGEIVRVCKKKGCWLDIGTPKQVTHVTFEASATATCRWTPPAARCGSKAR